MTLTDEVDSLRRVVVRAPFQVVHDDTAYGPNEVVEVPEALALEWLFYGWVTGDAKG